MALYLPHIPFLVEETWNNHIQGGFGRQDGHLPRLPIQGNHD